MGEGRVGGGGLGVLKLKGAVLGPGVRVEGVCEGCREVGLEGKAINVGL